MLPLDDYKPNTAQQAQIDVAMVKLEDKCLKVYGFGGLPTQSASLQQVPGPNSRRYGIANLTDAQKFGYHDRSEVHPSPGKKPGRLSAAEVSVLYGTGLIRYRGRLIPTDGCIGSARQALLSGSTAVDQPDLNQSLDQVANNQSMADQRVRYAFSAWSKCMARGGFNYSTPLSAIDDPAFTGPRVSSLEVATAIMDVKCKQRTNLLAVWAAVETGYQEVQISKHKEPLAKIRASFLKMVENARSAR